LTHADFVDGRKRLASITGSIPLVVSRRCRLCRISWLVALAGRLLLLKILQYRGLGRSSRNPSLLWQWTSIQSCVRNHISS